MAENQEDERTQGSRNASPPKEGSEIENPQGKEEKAMNGPEEKGGEEGEHSVAGDEKNGGSNAEDEAGSRKTDESSTKPEERADEETPGDGSEESPAKEESNAAQPSEETKQVISSEQQEAGDQSHGEQNVMTAAETVAVSTEGEESAAQTDSDKKPVDSSQPEASGESSAPPTEAESTETTEIKAQDERTSTSKSTRERKSRRRSRKADRTEAPALRKRTSRVDSRSRFSVSAGASGTKHLENVILSMFQPTDPDGMGFVQAQVFWELLQPSLHLSEEDLLQLQSLIPPDPATGLVPYAEFASHATDYIASLYTNQSPAEAHWVELIAANGAIAINYNKQTGEAMELAEARIDVFATVTEDLYQRTNPDSKGLVNWKMFSQLLQSAEMSPFLVAQDLKEMQELFKSSVPTGKANYDQFRVLAQELILRVYRYKDPSDNPWCKISSPEFGEVWFNKFTGSTHRGLQTGDTSREDEIAFVNEAYVQVQEISLELQQYKEQNASFANQLAKSEEEQEVLAAQLYDTGRALDVANNEIIRQENEVDQMKGLLENKDQEVELLHARLNEIEVLRTHLMETENELQIARDTIANRDSSITERDANILNLQKQTEAASDQLKTAHGEKDAQDSTLTKVEHQLQAAQKKLKDYERAVPELESDLSSAKDQLESSKHSLEEKTVALIQARKHLKSSREHNMELEKEVEKLRRAHNKLVSTESEIRTLKTFLTTKTALIEKHKKDLRETRLKIAELEEKDKRRAVILADVLEKTARQYQQQLGQPPRSSGVGGGGSPTGKGRRLEFQATPAIMDELRPYSAPAVPPEGVSYSQDVGEPMGATGVSMKSFTTGSDGPILTHSQATVPVPLQKQKLKTKTKNRSQSVPKLPPISRAGGKPYQQQRAKSFVFPTGLDLRRQNKLRDIMLVEHVPSNPQCNCELCRMNATVMGSGAAHRPETGLTGMSVKTAGLPGYHGETDVRELALAEQLQIGQRVMVRMKESEFDLEPSKLSGIIKYVGKIDSEFVDHRIYVGVKLDKAVGDTDGLVKNKRYFTCPPKHGKIVRITNVVKVLPQNSIFFKSLQEISKRSPYTTVQKKLTAQT